MGIACVTAGVLLHLPMYVGAADMGCRLSGISMDRPMVAGLALIVVGLVATTVGLVARPPGPEADVAGGIRVRALDDAPIRPAHVGLLLVMAAAVTIDVMKPTTLGFVLPGMTTEYGLKSALNPGGGPHGADDPEQVTSPAPTSSDPPAPGER